MHSRRLARYTVIATVAVLAIAITIFWTRFRDSRSRVEREHGLHLPASASAFECRGDAARGFLDRGAASAFVMSTNDLTNYHLALHGDKGRRQQWLRSVKVPG